MGEIDWKRKLTSRKFWLAIVGLVSGLMLAFNVDGETIDKVTGAIMSAASVIAYIIGEGLADAAGVALLGKNKSTYGEMEDYTDE